jgi:hypothetical protein
MSLAFSSRPRRAALFIVTTTTAFVATAVFPARAFEVQVVDHSGAPVDGFRWLVEEDNTYHGMPGTLDSNTLSVSFHKSHAPVIVNGLSTESTANISLPITAHYFVSVLPFSGYSIGGAAVAPGQTTVEVVVAKHAIPTAQISVFVFEDNQPINNAPDLPEEPGLGGQDFTIILSEAGGRYGQVGGQVSQDAFGNPLGTEYNLDGTVAMMGSGIIHPDVNGVALIKNLVPGKYGIQVVPREGLDWHQTSTIEGTRTIDAWVKANEPSYFVELGPPGHHVDIGFVHTINNTQVLTGQSEITGTVVNLHTSRPPDFSFYDGEPRPNCWIGLNDLAVGEGRGIYTAPCNADSSFSIPNVPPGNYQLVVWDEFLDNIIALHGVTVPPGGGEVPLLNVAVFNWFHRQVHRIFYDHNQNGFRDCATPACNGFDDDVAMSDQTVNLRFRDGTLYQSFPTVLSGVAPFDEVFPFFHWLIAEVDYLRFKATGVTTIVDAGGPVSPDTGWDYPSRNVLTPQPQLDAGGNSIINQNTGNNLSRTETGPILTKAFQGFLGQTNVFEWGKAAYGPGENGGITGIVYYATTRAENDPQYAAAEPWEPGVPRVQVNLYQDADNDGSIDDLDSDNVITPPDVDNYPFDSQDNPFPGAGDVDYNGNGEIDFGDALNIATTDSWDDNLPAGCQGDVFLAHGQPTDCFDGLRNFNQIRDGVFDGGYAFDSYVENGTEIPGLPARWYIVEVVPPPGYEIVKEEDKNVDLGDKFVPTPSLLPSPCVGEPHLVPVFLSLQTNDDGDPLPGIATADLIAAPFAAEMRPLCDRRHIKLNHGQNAATDFFVLTMVPKASRVVGFILDDLSNEFDPSTPNFGEKFAPPWLPIAVRDFTGREIARTHADEWGKYNALLPSTYTVNVPAPSGVSPNMLTACMNDPGPIPNPDYNPDDPNSPQMVIDPFFNRQYSQFCYTFQYMPGTTTYLDTPVIPIAAFAGPDQFPLDCEFQDDTPLIYSVSGPNSAGPIVTLGQTLTLVSQGNVPVPNPAYDGTNDKTIVRDYGFGDTQGTVRIGGVPLFVTSWTNDVITAIVFPGTSTGQLIVTRDGVASPVGVTVTVGTPAGTVRHVQPSATPGATPIQDAIDLALPNELIIVHPGIYEELVIMWKPVRLQGTGAASTIINAVKAPGEKLQNWRNKINALVASGSIDLLPGQETGFDPGNNEPLLFTTEESPGILVVARDRNPNQGGFGQNPNARIDGLTITGADTGGGIFVNGYAHFLEVSNNRILSNLGTFGGGIRFGHPQLTAETNQGLVYPDAQNNDVRVHHNQITYNGSLGGAGAGIAVCTGTDDYQISDNTICGNFAQAHGGGIGHLGLSDGGSITHNVILFNQSFAQGTSVSGGGLFIGGAPGLGGPGSLSPGSGSVMVNRNVIQGNLAGAGDGGGIRTAFVSGEDVASSQNNPNQWYQVAIVNNFIVNNVAGLAGAGISMQDTPRISIIHNTVVHNDSTATAGEAFAAGSPNESTPQPAGIVSRAHSASLADAFGNSPNVLPFRVFSNPQLVNNIIWQNRSFNWVIDQTTLPDTFGLLPDVGAGDPPVYHDLAVLGVAALLNPRSCILTDTTGYHSSNIQGNPMFVGAYFNGDRGQTIVMPEITTSIATAPAFDEGGNFIDVRFGPLTPSGDYHIGAGSPAQNNGDPSVLFLFFPQLLLDIDEQFRLFGTGPDIGADERQVLP